MEVYNRNPSNRTRFLHHSTSFLIDLRDQRESKKISFVFIGKEIGRRSRIFPARGSLDEWRLFQEFERELLFRKGRNEHYEKFACEDLSNRRITKFCGIVRGLGLSSRELERDGAFYLESSDTSE